MKKAFRPARVHRRFPRRPARQQDALPNLVRRCTTAESRGRRGWATDPGWKTRNRLLRNREDLTDEQFERMWNPLLDKGLIGQRLLTA